MTRVTLKTGRVAQRESTAFTRQGSLVQSQPRPPVLAPYLQRVTGFFFFLSGVNSGILSLILRVMGREAVRKVGLTCRSTSKREDSQG